MLDVSSYWQPVASGVILLACGAGELARREVGAAARGMSAFLARNRLILLAYLGMVVLLLVTSLFSPGFLSASNLRSIVVLAAFVGIVALGQTFVIIGGGIDLSVPWVLNSRRHPHGAALRRPGRAAALGRCRCSSRPAR